MGRSQFEEALLTHKSLILGWMRDFSQQSNVNVHELSGGLHTGGLSDAQAPQFLKVDGSRQLSGNLSVLDGVTIDGVDLSAHAASVNAHHEPVTILDTATIDLSLSGQQISGSVIQSALDHGSIGGLGDDDHTQYFNTTRHTLLVHTNLGLTPNTRQIISGNGLSGGGDLSADRTLAVGAGTGISVGADSVGIDLAANLTWTGNHVFQGGLSTRHLLPELTDTYDLGSSVLLWRKGWLSELDTVLFAQNSVTLLGGWLLISKDEGALVGDVLAADTTIDFGKSMTVGDFVLMRASLKMEYMQVGAVVSGTIYNVTRNLDGSGANDWAGGTPFAVLGTTGNGRIELNAYDTPRISIIEQGATYNAQTERIRIGDLAAWQGAGFTGYGIAIGNYSGGESLVYSPGGGLEVRGTIKADDGYLQNLTVQGLLNLSTSGELRAGTTTNGLRFGYLSDGYYLRGIGGGTTQVEIRASDGKLYAGDGAVTIDEAGLSYYGSGSSESSRTIQWYDTSNGNRLTGYIYSDYGGGGGVGTTMVLAIKNTGDPWSYPLASLIADDKTASLDVRLVVGATDGGIIYATHKIWGAGNIRTDGNFISYKNSTEYTGYIFVPLTTPLTSTSYNGDDTISVGTRTIDTSSVFGAPVGIKAALVYVRAKWASAGDYYLIVRPGGGGATTDVDVIRGSTTYYDDMTVLVPCDANGDFDIVVGGANATNVIIKIFGYWI
jgi:hypothetical protein